MKICSFWRKKNILSCNILSSNDLFWPIKSHYNCVHCNLVFNFIAVNLYSIFFLENKLFKEMSTLLHASVSVATDRLEFDNEQREHFPSDPEKPGYHCIEFIQIYLIHLELSEMVNLTAVGSHISHKTWRNGYFVKSNMFGSLLKWMFALFALVLIKDC